MALATKTSKDPVQAANAPSHRLTDASNASSDSPRLAAQRRWTSVIQNSPKMLAQRRLSDIARAGPVLQGYFRIAHAQHAAAGVVVGSTMPAIEHHGATASHVNAAGALNEVQDNPVVPVAGGPVATLRISDDGRLAVEDVDLTGRQPRVVFAEPHLVTQANEQLKARTGSDMLTTNPGAVVQVPEAGDMATIHNLVEVVPSAHFATSANCDEVANALTGADTQSTAVKVNTGVHANAPQGTRQNDVYERLAHFSAYGHEPGAATFHARLLDTANLNFPMLGGPLPDPANINNIVANKRANPDGDAAAIDAREQALGINSYADPDVGEMYGSMSLGAVRDFGGAVYGQYDERTNRYMSPNPASPHARNWATHFGGVVLKSGGDHVTLENYNRTVEDAGIGAVAGAHDRWYFQMYGTKRTAALAVDPLLAAHVQPGDEALGVDQSWHNTWSLAGRPVSNAVTTVIGKVEHPLNLSAVSALAHSMGTGDITAGHDIDIRINCTVAMQNQLLAGFTGRLKGALNAMGDLVGARSLPSANARKLAAHAAILRVFATTNGDAQAKLAAALMARTQLDADGAGSAHVNTPPNLVARLNGYGIVNLPAGV